MCENSQSIVCHMLENRKEYIAVNRTFARKYKQHCTLNNIAMELYDIIHSTFRHN